MQSALSLSLSLSLHETQRRDHSGGGPYLPPESERMISPVLYVIMSSSAEEGSENVQRAPCIHPLHFHSHVAVLDQVQICLRQLCGLSHLASKHVLPHSLKVRFLLLFGYEAPELRLDWTRTD
jgi:hypothetical protein